ALHTPQGTVSGFFNDLDKCVTAVERSVRQFNGQSNFYLVMNPVNPDCLARAANRLKPRVKDTTSDRDVLVRRFLLFDFDPARPAGISSTDEELQRARTLQAEVIGWLMTTG